MDYGKFKFDEAQRAKESRRKTTSTSIKEMKYRPKIGTGDFDTKTRQVSRFLSEGHKVKITIMFRGREMSHPELGKKILDQVAEQVASRRQGRGGAQARRPQHDHGAGPGSPGPAGGATPIRPRTATSRTAPRWRRSRPGRTAGPRCPLGRPCPTPSGRRAPRSSAVRAGPDRPPPRRRRRRPGAHQSAVAPRDPAVTASESPPCAGPEPADAARAQEH